MDDGVCMCQCCTELEILEWGLRASVAFVFFGRCRISHAAKSLANQANTLERGGSVTFTLWRYQKSMHMAVIVV